MKKYFKKIDSTDNISEWKSKEFSNEVIKFPSKYDKSYAPELILIN